MKKAFMCSLCHKGVIGGVLYLDSETITYKTNKLTIDKRLRNLVFPLSEIHKITWMHQPFPIATFRMKNGEEYKFLIFNKPRFTKHFELFTKGSM